MGNHFAHAKGKQSWADEAQEEADAAEAAAREADAADAAARVAREAAAAAKAACWKPRSTAGASTVKPNKAPTLPATAKASVKPVARPMQIKAPTLPATVNASLSTMVRPMARPQRPNPSPGPFADLRLRQWASFAAANAADAR